MINNQPIEKRTRADGSILEVHSIFYTIQGEGPFSGVPAVFVRLAGCNLQCPWCDTDYTSRRFEADVAYIVGAVGYTRVKGILGDHAYVGNLPNAGLVVITGGEPFRQELAPLLRELVKAGFFVQIESNGTLPPPSLGTASTSFAYYNHDTRQRDGVYLVCSPKTGKVHPLADRLACCYKYVMDADNVDPEDGLPVTALGHTANPRLARPGLRSKPVYLQPADHKDPAANQRNIDAVIKSCQKHGYTLQLQIHKYLGVE